MVLGFVLKESEKGETDPDGKSDFGIQVGFRREEMEGEGALNSGGGDWSRLIKGLEAGVDDTLRGRRSLARLCCKVQTEMRWPNAAAAPIPSPPGGTRIPKENLVFSPDVE